MEEAPKSTFQDELEWCITQLETGLLRLNPTPEQAKETQHILGVLRSGKAPLGKKRQVMHHVFGDYRLKMAEEKKRAGKAAERHKKVEIQPGNVLALGSVVYRKQSSCPSTTPSTLLTSSDNSFQFNFIVPEGTAGELDGSPAGAPGLHDSREPSAGNGPSGTVDFSTGTQKPGFAFNFVIPDAPSLSSVARVAGSGATAEAAAEIDFPPEEARATPEGSASSKSDGALVMDSAGRRDGGVEGTPRLETAKVAPTEGEGTRMIVATSGSSKRKKKRKQPPSMKAPSDKAGRENKPCGSAASGQAEMSQKQSGDQLKKEVDWQSGDQLKKEVDWQSGDQLKKEVDWCVEQLELGLKTQKSTPKQTDDALRAIKTLRSKKTVLAKKRQLMRVMFGDYRGKMEEERRKQLKLMQAASKAAHIAKVAEDSQKKRSQVFRRSAKVSRTSQNPREPSSVGVGGADPFSFAFTPSQEEFCFNFF